VVRDTSFPVPISPLLPLLRRSRRALTDEEDGEGDEEQEDMRHHVERVHEAAVVEHALVHPVGGRVVLAAAEGQGHGDGRGRGRGLGFRLAPRASRASVLCSSAAWPGRQLPRATGPAPPRRRSLSPTHRAPLPAGPRGRREPDQPDRTPAGVPAVCVRGGGGESLHECLAERVRWE
jgi:hypothetical protein